VIAFVIMRDRVTYARQCVAALEAARLDVVLFDVDSSWPPAREWIDSQHERWQANRLIRSFINQHPRDLWCAGGRIEDMVRPGERFIVTDCDVVPDETCPADWVQVLSAYLDHFPHVVKAGLGLRTDDLPDHFAHRAQVQAWERQFQLPDAGTAAPVVYNPSHAGGAAWADIDTTLAMYRRYETFRLGPAIRTIAPYVARHLPWYEDSANPTDEQAFYAARAEHGHWRAPDGFEDHHGLERS
jgi:hypothetical protein